MGNAPGLITATAPIVKELGGIDARFDRSFLVLVVGEVAIPIVKELGGIDA